MAGEVLHPDCPGQLPAVMSLALAHASDPMPCQVELCPHLASRVATTQPQRRTCAAGLAMAPRLLSPRLWLGCLVIVMVPGVSMTPVTLPPTLVIRVQQCDLSKSLSEGCHCALRWQSTPQPLLPNESDPFHGDRMGRTPSAGVGRVGPLPQGSDEADLFRRGRASWTPSTGVGQGGSFMWAPTGPFSFGPTSVVMPPKLSPWGFSE